MHGVAVHIEREFKDIDYPARKLKKLVRAICDRFNIADVTVSIAIVDNIGIRKLNRKFLNRNTITDCLAFDLSEKGRRWFELVVNGEKAKTEAMKRGNCEQAELALYVTHGLLHNLGFDDESTAKSRKMHCLEDEILQQQGFGFVYDNPVKSPRPRAGSKVKPG